MRCDAMRCDAMRCDAMRVRLDVGATLTLLVSPSQLSLVLTKEELSEAFRNLDEDRNGYVEMSEFIAFFKRKGAEVAIKEVRLLWHIALCCVAAAVLPRTRMCRGCWRDVTCGRFDRDATSCRKRALASSCRVSETRSWARRSWGRCSR
jgi:hypothetical protein